jgi:AraC-like DNA-binding protein
VHRFGTSQELTLATGEALHQGSPLELPGMDSNHRSAVQSRVSCQLDDRARTVGLKTIAPVRPERMRTYVPVKDRVRTLLDAGWTRQAIATDLGVDPSTVTRYARSLGLPDAGKRSSHFDWSEIQAYYDAGHTISECRARFGCSYGAWDKAAMRGDIKVRPRSGRQLSQGTRDSVEKLLARGASQAAIADELGLSKSTVAYHCRRLGLRADPRFARRYAWSDVQTAIDKDGLSMSECIRRFGFCRETWADAVARGDIVPLPHVTPIRDLLVAGRRRGRGHIKARLIKEGPKAHRCESCGLSEWLGRPLGLELHHINGDGRDNRLENLMLLCGNCHGQTDNWGGRGLNKSARVDPEEVADRAGL